MNPPNLTPSAGSWVKVFQDVLETGLENPVGNYTYLGTIEDTGAVRIVRTKVGKQFTKSHQQLGLSGKNFRFHNGRFWWWSQPDEAEKEAAELAIEKYVSKDPSWKHGVVDQLWSWRWDLGGSSEGDDESRWRGSHYSENLSNAQLQPVVHSFKAYAQKQRPDDDLQQAFGPQAWEVQVGRATQDFENYLSRIARRIIKKLTVGGYGPRTAMRPTKRPIDVKDEEYEETKLQNQGPSLGDLG